MGTIEEWTSTSTGPNGYPPIYRGKQEWDRLASESEVVAKLVLEKVIPYLELFQSRTEKMIERDLRQLAAVMEYNDATQSFRVPASALGLFPTLAHFLAERLAGKPLPEPV